MIHYLFLELQRVDAEREAHQQKIDELEKQKQEQIERIESEGDVLLELPGPLKHSSSHTSLSSTEVYREFESAEPIHLTLTGKETSPESIDVSSQDAVDSPAPQISISGVLTDDMTTALVGMYSTYLSN